MILRIGHFVISVIEILDIYKMDGDLELFLDEDESSLTMSCQTIWRPRFVCGSNDIDLAQEVWRKDPITRKWHTSYHFTSIDPLEFMRMEAKSRDLGIRLAKDSSLKLVGEDRDHQFLHEILKGYGRIVMDIDLDGPMLEELYEMYPSEKWVPKGFTKAVEDLVFKVIYDLDQDRGKLLLKEKVMWNTMPTISEASPFCWTNACRDGKVSFHLTLPIWLDQLPEGLKIFYTLMNDMARRDWRFRWLKGASLMDMNLCGRHHQLRLPWQLKRKYPGALEHAHRLMDPTHRWNHAISSEAGYFIPEEWKMDISWAGCHPFITMPESQEPGSFDGEMDQDEAMQLLAQAYIDLDTRGYEGIEAHKKDHQTQTGWRLKPKGPQDCPCCHRIHAHTSNSPMICASYNRFYLFCYQSLHGGGDKITLGPRKGQDLRGQTREKVASFSVELYHRPMNMRTIHIHEQNLRHNESIDHKAKLLLIKSAMGTGKSELVHDIIEAKPKARTLIITNRVVQAKDYNYKYKDQGFVLYDPKGHGWEDAPRLIVELESLWRVVLDQYDIVILDEIMAIVGLFIGRTMDGKIRSTWDKLESYIRMASQVICMDAFLTEDVAKQMSWMCRGRSQQYIINDFKPNERQPRIVSKYVAEPEFNGQILEDRRRKFIASNDATWAINIGKRLIASGVNVLFQLGEDKMAKADEHGISKDHIRSPDPNLWDKHDTVITTPAVMNGISFEKDHFETLYIYTSRNSCNPIDMLQMTFRVRKFKDPDVHWFISKKLIPDKIGSVFPKEIVRDKDQATKAWYRTTQEQDLMPLARIWNEATMDLKHILIMALARQNAGRLFMDEIMEALITQSLGWSIIPATTGGNMINRKDPIPNSMPIQMSQESMAQLKADMDIFHTFIKKEWEKAQHIYDTIWTKSGDGKENLIDMCRMARIELMEQKVQALSERIDNEPDKIQTIEFIERKNRVETMLKRWDGTMPRSKLHCWRSFLNMGKMVRQDETMVLKFNSKMVQTNEWRDLMNKIGSCWTRHNNGLQGRKVWESITKWLQKGMMISSVQCSASDNNHGIREYIYMLDLNDWIGLHVVI